MPTLTDGTIKRAINEVEKTWKQRTLTDGEGRGTGRLVLMLRPMSARVVSEWMVQQWRHGRRIKAKIGDYPSMTLAGAREVFKRDFSDLIQKGRSVKVAGDTRAGTVGDLFDGYVEHLKREDKMSWESTSKSFNKVVDLLGRNRLAREIEPDDIIDVLRPIYERGNHSQYMLIDYLIFAHYRKRRIRAALGFQQFSFRRRNNFFVPCR
jgi:hypothetical protein